MTRTTGIFSQYGKAAIFGLLALYCLVFPWFGVSDTDVGFVQGFAWRVAQGEVPYRDFILARPPLSLYLHSASMFMLPDAWQVIFERALFFATVFAYSWLAVSVLGRFFDLEDMKLDRHLLVGICFVFSAHHHFPMPWFSTDGILLAVLGAWLITKDKSYASTAVGMTALCLAALTKQSFYPLPLAGVVLALVLHGWKRAALAAGVAALAAGTFLGLLARAGALGEFFAQTNAFQGKGPLLENGFTEYFQEKIIYYYLLIPAGAYVLARLANRAGLKRVNANAVLAWGVFLMLFAKSAFQYLSCQCSRLPRPWPQFFFLATLAWCLINFSFKDKRIAVLLFFMAIAWCASLSYGYSSPILFSTPIVFGMFLIIRQYFPFKGLRTFYAFVLAGAVLLYALGRFFPFYDSRLDKLTYDMGETFPRLAHVKSDKESYEKYMELKGLVAKYGDNYLVVPNMPWAHYLTNTRSLVPGVWLTDFDSAFQDKKIIHALETNRVTVFMEKELTPFVGYSKAMDHVKENWRPVEETGHFTVYLPPKAPGEAGP